MSTRTISSTKRAARATSKAFQIARDLLNYEVDLAVVDPWVDPEKLPQDLRVLHLQKNMGKAHGLNLALAISHGEIIVTLDAR
ncbi:glycosyltransferase [uncultured Megasphaera sp.]|uniref:glycosyltransferase n=1 Tax=uncultured Megasphaera sp. TaxID=165188 RepID=UPI0025CC7F7B|nr:glycosyltransferase [uncultured Megasphaera sp.]